jgi:hypothetical protein
MERIIGMTEGAISAVLIMMKKQELQGSWKMPTCCVALQTAPLNVCSYTPRCSVICAPCIWTFLNSPETFGFSITPLTDSSKKKIRCAKIAL